MEKISRNQRMSIEVSEILKYMDMNLKSKIPSEILQKFQNVDNNNYKFIYDKDKKLNDQRISEDTKNMISYLYIKYCCDANKKKKILEKIKINKEKEAQKDREKNWLLNKKVEDIEEKTNIEETALVKKEDNSFLAKILSKIKSLFNKNN